MTRILAVVAILLSFLFILQLPGLNYTMQAVRAGTDCAIVLGDDVSTSFAEMIGGKAAITPFWARFYVCESVKRAGTIVLQEGTQFLVKFDKCVLVGKDLRLSSSEIRIVLQDNQSHRVESELRTEGGQGLKVTWDRPSDVTTIEAKKGIRGTILLAEKIEVPIPDSEQDIAQKK